MSPIVDAPLNLGGVRSPIARSRIVAHLPSFVVKMRVHSFGGRYRRAVCSPLAWIDVDRLEERSGPDSPYGCPSTQFKYGSRGREEVDNSFTIEKHGGQSYVVRFSSMVLLRTADVSPPYYVASFRELSKLAIDALLDAMFFVRQMTRDIYDLSTNGIGLRVFGDGARNEGEEEDIWLPRLMVVRVRKFTMSLDGRKMGESMFTRLPVMPRIEQITILNCDLKTTLRVLERVVRRNGRLSKLTITAPGNNIDKSTLPRIMRDYSIDDLCLRDVHWPILPTQLDQLTDVTSIEQLNCRVDYPPRTTSGRARSAIDASAQLIAGIPSLHRIVTARHYSRTSPPDLQLGAQELKGVLAAGEACRWILSTALQCPYNSCLVRIALIIMELVKALHSSSAPHRHVSLKLNLRSNVLMDGYALPLRQFLSDDNYDDVNIEIIFRVGDEVDVRIVDGKLLLPKIE